RTLLHARAARGGNNDQGRLLEHGEFGGGEHGLADGDAHRSAHELEFEHSDDARNAADLAVGDDDGVAAGAECGLTLPEALGIAPAIAELQRVDDRFRQLDPGEGTVTEDELEALLGADPQVMAAIA